LTGLCLLRAGEGAALESEQLRFEQLLRQCCAIDRDERTTAPRRAAVDEPGHDFLAGPRLALEAGRRFGGGNARRALQHVLPGDRCAEHVFRLTAVVQRDVASVSVGAVTVNEVSPRQRSFDMGLHTYSFVTSPVRKSPQFLRPALCQPI